MYGVTNSDAVSSTGGCKQSSIFSKMVSNFLWPFKDEKGTSNLTQCNSFS